MDITKISKLFLGAGVLLIGVFGISEYSAKHPEKYSLKWIKSLSDEEWDKEREILRKMCTNPKYDDNSRIRYGKILDLFDRVKSDRNWEGKIPQPPKYHREHGFNLYKPEK